MAAAQLASFFLHTSQFYDVPLTLHSKQRALALLRSHTLESKNTACHPLSRPFVYICAKKFAGPHCILCLIGVCKLRCERHICAKMEAQLFATLDSCGCCQIATCSS